MISGGGAEAANHHSQAAGAKAANHRQSSTTMFPCPMDGPIAAWNGWLWNGWLFDRHYTGMPGGLPSPDASARGNADDHHSELKRKADSDGISRSLSEVFADLTHGTAPLEEAKKLLTIITNVNYIVYLAGLIFVLWYQ
jgi:hypothetical protein